MPDALAPDPFTAMAAQLTPKRAVSYIRVSTREQAQRGGSEEGFSLPAQREANKRKAQSMGALVVKEFADRGESARSANRPELQKMLAYLKEDGGIDYVITAGWPTPNLTTTEADAVTDQLAQAGTHLVCLNTWHPGDGELPAWWNDEEGAWMRQLDELREQERQQREQTSETGVDNQVNQASRTGNASQSTEPSKEVHHA